MNTKSSTETFLYRTAAALVVVLLALAALPVAPAYAAACIFTSNVNPSGDWSNPASWTTTGTDCGSYPGAGFSGDQVVLSVADTITLDVSPLNPIGSLSFPLGSNQSVALNFNPGTALIVSGDLTLPRAQSGRMNMLAVGAGTLNIQGDLAFTNSGTEMRHQLTISTGTVVVSGDVTVDTVGNPSPTISFSDAGTLKLNGGLWSGGGGTLSLVTGSTVEYNGAGAQTVKALAYSNLILSGSGDKTLTVGFSVTGNLSIAPTGSAKANVVGGELSVETLTLGGLGRINGTWGATSSAATYQNDTYFAATAGRLNVLTDTRATPDVTTWPTASGITFGQMLSASTLTGGSASVPGAFVFDTPSFEPDAASTYSAAVIFAPTDLTSYKSVGGSVDVAVAKANATIMVMPYHIVYDGTEHTATGTATGVNGEDLSSGLDLSSTAHTNAGIYDSDPWTFTSPNTNYNDGSGMVSNTIVKVDATIVITPYNVTYDGTEHTATGTATGVNGEDLSSGLDLSSTAHTNAGTYDSDPWTFTSPSPNYNNDVSTVSNTITPRSLTISGLTANDKVYNGTTSTTLSGSPSLVGVLSGDTVNLGGTPVADFVDANVGTGKPVIVSGYALSGASASNYSITQPTDLTASITPASLTVTGITASHKVYDGDTTATLDSSAAVLVGVLSGDVVSLDTSGATGAFNNKNVGTAKTVTVSGLTLTGADAGNYVITPPTTTADITARDLTVSVTGIDKVYDGTPVATVNLSTDALPGDTVTPAYTSASFADKNVGNGKAVSVSGISLGGPDGGNYNLLNTTANTTADITPLDITVTAHAKSKFIGTPDPKLTYFAVPALFSGDAFTGALTRVAGEAEGQYAIQQGTLSAGSNYTIVTFVGADLTIVPVTSSNLSVYINNNFQKNYTVEPHGSDRDTYTGVNAGPVKLVSTNNVPIMAAERLIYKVNNVNTSFSEMMALPDDLLDSTYWLPWYNHVGLDTQLRIANVSGSTATVNVYIGGQLMQGSPFTLIPGESIRPTFTGINNGPVKVVSDVKIVVAERVIYKVNNVNTSFTELMALPNSQLDNVYWLPWYNNVGLDTQLRIANVSNSTAIIHVTINGQPGLNSPFTVPPGESIRPVFPSVNNGPVKIESNVDIVAAERVIYKVNNVFISFSEMMAIPEKQLDTTYWLPWYNNVGLDTQLRFANVGNAQTTVHIFINGQEMGTGFPLQPGESTRQDFDGINNGPVKVVSDQPLVVAERVIYKVNNVNTSFTEMMALPNDQLDTTYWLPWYNNTGLDTQLRFGVP